MPGNEITLVDVFEKLLRVEIIVSELLTNQKACSSFQLEDDGIIESDKGAGAFVNPDTGMNDVNYYRKQHPKDERK